MLPSGDAPRVAAAMAVPLTVGAHEGGAQSSGEGQNIYGAENSVGAPDPWQATSQAPQVIHAEFVEPEPQAQREPAKTPGTVEAGHQPVGKGLGP
jgi:hypothetical protein